MKSWWQWFSIDKLIGSYLVWLDHPFLAECCRSLYLCEWLHYCAKTQGPEDTTKTIKHTCYSLLSHLLKSSSKIQRASCVPYHYDKDKQFFSFASVKSSDLSCCHVHLSVKPFTKEHYYDPDQALENLFQRRRVYSSSQTTLVQAQSLTVLQLIVKC